MTDPGGVFEQHQSIRAAFITENAGQAIIHVATQQPFGIFVAFMHQPGDRLQTLHPVARSNRLLGAAQLLGCRGSGIDRRNPLAQLRIG